MNSKNPPPIVANNKTLKQSSISIATLIIYGIMVYYKVANDFYEIGLEIGKELAK